MPCTFRYAARNHAQNVREGELYEELDKIPVGKSGFPGTLAEVKVTNALMLNRSVSTIFSSTRAA